MKITVFTPTYNRGYCLERLFKSLLNQTFTDFEWLIIDDGSIDNTEELVKDFQESCKDFPIIYKKTENGGKHRAINRGMSLVNGEMILFMDSDDWLRKDALEWIIKIDESIPKNEKQKYAGLQGLCVNTDGKLVVRTFSGDKFVDCTTLEREKFNIYGDKAEVYYTNVISRYPFPEIEGEKFATESLVWNKIGHDGYKIRYFNEGIYYCEYLEDGLTHGGNVLYAKNPKQWAMAIYQDYDYGLKNFYNTTIQVYIYYLYEKGHISIKEMSDNLKISLVKVSYAIISQKIIDMIRFIVHKKTTLAHTVQLDVKKNNWNRKV